jgi:ABC-2 type transport system permease protein
MLKLILIGLKDLKLIFRDRAALILMLLAPFALTLGLGFVTGRFSGNNGSGLSDIPVAIVNLDKGQLGNALVDVFKSEDLSKLVEPTELDSPEAARRLIDEDKSAAAVIIPKSFTESIIPTQSMLDLARQAGAFALETVKIEVYVNPSRPTGAGVVKAIVDEFISRVEASRINGMTSLLGIPGIETMPTDKVESLAGAMFESADEETFSSAAIALKTDAEGAEAVDFDPLAYLAPGMALMFLMYTGGTHAGHNAASAGFTDHFGANFGRQGAGDFPDRSGPDGDFDPGQRTLFPGQVGRPVGDCRADCGSGLWRDRLGHVDHSRGAHARTGGEPRFGPDADFRYPGR